MARLHMLVLGEVVSSLDQMHPKLLDTWLVEALLQLYLWA